MTRRAGMTALVFIMTMLCAHAFCAETAVQDALKRGVEYSREGRDDEAIAEFNKVIALSPSLVDAYYNRALVYYKKGMLDASIADWSRSIEIDPASADAYYNRGLAYYKKGSFDKAISDYNKVMAINPEATDALYGRGLAYFKKNDIKQAIADYDKVIEARPEFPLAYSARAVAYFYKKDYGRTLADVNKAVALGFRARPLRKTPDTVVEERIVEKVVVVEKAPTPEEVAQKAARRAIWMARKRVKTATIVALAGLLVLCLAAIFVLLKTKRTSC